VRLATMRLFNRFLEGIARVDNGAPHGG
jgi:hypothetical protein